VLLVLLLALQDSGSGFGFGLVEKLAVEAVVI
jgi:hypothetical protein